MKIKKILLFSLVVTLIFVVGDFLAHNFVSNLIVNYYPFQYFNIPFHVINYAISKFIFTFIALIILQYLFNKYKTKPMNQYWASLVVIVGILQIRYTMLDYYYTTSFHYYNFVNHVITFSIGYWIARKCVTKQ